MSEMDEDQAAEVLRGAAGKLPEEAETGEFEALMQAGQYEAALRALRELGVAYPLPLGFWAEVSKAADLLGVE